MAVTVSAAFIVTAHGLIPEHPAPLHPTNALPLAGVAVSVTTVPLAKLAAQLGPVPVQLIPLGTLVTVPVPVPGSVTVSV